MQIPKTGEVVWYVTGRFYARGTSLLDLGYFIFLGGIGAPLFAGAPSESTAFFTFSAAPFTASKIDNGGLGISVDATGSFALYVRDEPGASFDDPASFAAGRCIATFERVSIVAATQITAPSGMALTSNVFTARLVSSERFDFGGRTYDLAELIGDGITQWGTAASEPLAPPSGYDAVAPFVGSAIRLG